MGGAAVRFTRPGSVPGSSLRRPHKMPSKKRSRVPSYRLHKSSGQAVVTIAGRDVYLGPHGTKASKLEYDRLVAEWLAAGRPTHVQAHCGEITLSEVMAAYWRHVKRRYVKNGRPTSEQHCIRSALRPHAWQMQKNSTTSTRFSSGLRKAESSRSPDRRLWGRSRSQDAGWGWTLDQ